MTQRAAAPADSGGSLVGTDTVCRRACSALLAMRTRYGLAAIDIAAMDRITALRVAATCEFLSNNLPQEAPPATPVP